MPESRICAKCAKPFEASEWSSTEYCDDCAKSIVASAPSPRETGAAAEPEPVARGWSIQPPPVPRHAAAEEDEVEDVSVVEEEVPVSEADSIIGSREKGGWFKAPWMASMRGFGFWLVLAMGVMPLFIGGIDNPVHRLTGLLFFFALLWGAVFQGMILRSRSSLVAPFLAFFFTGVVGLFVLYTVYAFLPVSYLSMALSDNPLTLLFGQVLQVGLCEEICKLVPVAAYLAIKGERASASTAILVGVYSGLGFAAFENTQYSQAMIMAAAQDVYSAGKYGGHAAATFGGEDGTYQIIGVVLLRVFSLVFLHAVFSGIAASLLVAGGVKRIAAAVAAPALLHGLYNWLSGVNTIPAGLVIAVSFYFFCANLDKAKSVSFGKPRKAL